MSSDLPFERELRVAISAARRAGRAALAHYGSTVAEMKAANSPVTAADHASNEVILSILRGEFPEDAILSEESKDSGARLTASRVWIVDPLDGTKEFLAQNGEFSVMIGLTVDGEPVLGVVYLPDGDILFYAAKGGGAWVEREGLRTALRCQPAQNTSLRMVGSRSHPDALVLRIQEALHISDVRPSGSVGIKCALIAQGERDLYVHPVPFLKEWDTCAPEIILREAGGRVTDCLGGLLQYNKLDPAQAHGILACAPELGALALERITTLYAGRGA